MKHARIFAAGATLALASTLFAAPASAAPERHLQYAFSTYPTRRVAPANVGIVDGPGTGVMNVDVLGLASDGGLVVQMQDQWWYTIRPLQSRTCEVFPNGGTNCGVFPSPTVAERVLLPLLARDYFAGISNGTWTQKYLANLGDGLFVYSADFNLNALGTSDDGRIVKIASQGSIAQVGGRYRKASDTAWVTYDKVAGVPLTVHDVVQATPNNSVFSSVSVDLQMRSDSAATR